MGQCIGTLAVEREQNARRLQVAKARSIVPDSVTEPKLEGIEGKPVVVAVSGERQRKSSNPKSVRFVFGDDDEVDDDSDSASSESTSSQLSEGALVRTTFPEGEVLPFASHVEVYLTWCEARRLEPSVEEVAYQATNDVLIEGSFDAVSRRVIENPRSWVELFLLYSLKRGEIVSSVGRHRDVYNDLDRLLHFVRRSGEEDLYRLALSNSSALFFDEVASIGARVFYSMPGLDQYRLELVRLMNKEAVLAPLMDKQEATVLQCSWKLQRVSKALHLDWDVLVEQYA